MSNNNFLDDLQKLTASAMNSFAGGAKHFEEMIKSSVESFLLKMDFVRREELSVIREMLQQSLERIDQLEKKVTALEALDKPNKRSK